MPIMEAKISVLDRGFIFGDGVYEVIPVYSRCPFRLNEHLNRLQHSLDGIQLPNPHTLDEWANILTELIARNEAEDQSLYLHITRGVARRDFPFPKPVVSPTVFVMSNPLDAPQLSDSGVSAVTAWDNRWQRCDIKAISLLPNVLLRQIAVAAGCAETILIRPATAIEPDFLTEGAASNIFVIKDGMIFAPPKDNMMLPGITYDVILEIAAEQHIPLSVRRISKTELFAADELLLTSSTREVMAITSVDGKPTGTGVPGPVFAQLYQFYQEYKRKVMHAK